MVAVQPFDLKRRDKMGYHTDSKPLARAKHAEVAQAQGAPVLTLNLYEDFMFWTIPIINGDVIDKKQRLDYKQQVCIRMSDGVSMMWPEADDHAFKHGVWPCPCMSDASVRVSVVYRWSNPERPLQRFALEYPHRML